MSTHGVWNTIVYSTQPLLPLFTKEFHLDPTTSSLSLSIVIFCISIALLFYGPLLDAVGRKSVMVRSMIAASIAT